jgi:hypothetical protein
MIRTTSIELVEPDRIQWFGPNNPAPQFKHPVLPFAPMRLEGYVQLICVCGPLDDLVDVRDILDALRRGDPRIFVPVRSDNP